MSSASRARPSTPASAGSSPIYALPDLALPGRPEAVPQQPEFVQTPAQYLREPTFARLAAQGKKFAAQYRDTLARIEQDVRRARQRRAGDLGARDRLRPERAAARRAARAGDARLCRQAQGFLPQRVPARAEDAAGRRAARRSALVLGRRHGPHPVPAVGILQIRRRFRRRRQDRHLAFGAGRARLGGQAARRTKAGSAGEPWAIEVRVPAIVDCTVAEPGHVLPIARMAQARLRAGLRPQADDARNSPPRPRCCCRKAPTARPS